jgi:hypothetical protein
MTKISFAAVATVSTLLLGCASSVNVSTDFDRTADFTGFETYAWPERPTGQDQRGTQVKPESEAQLISAVERELGEKGYRKSTASPDFLVTFMVTTEERQDSEKVYTDHNLGYAFSTTQTRTFTDGTLFLIVAQPADQMVIWQGAAKETFQNPSQQTINDAIDRLVKGILKKFPPEQ